jgi:microcompartment protein CcmK/EutM
MLIVGRIDENPDEILERFVAIDAVGAGEGMLVGVIQGAPAQRSLDETDAPVDAVIVAIFDAIRMDGEPVYQK